MLVSFRNNVMVACFVFTFAAGRALLPLPYRRYSEDGTLELNLIMAKLVLPMHDECIRVQPH